jgi:hypothetical protein
VEISPLYIATTKPVALTKRLSTGVKASIIGVKITPPPMPASTDIMAMRKLMRKKPSNKAVIVSVDIPPSGVSALWEIINSARKDMTNTTDMPIISTQGDLAYLLTPVCFRNLMRLATVTILAPHPF